MLAAVLCGALLGAGCGGAPGEREYRGGLREIERGNYVRAKALFEKSITRRPGSGENAAAYNYVGLASYRLGQIEGAIDAFETSRRLDPDLPDPVYNLAVILFESGDLPRSTALFEEAAQFDEADPRPLEYLGWIDLRAGDGAAARRVLAAALARAPQSARVLTALANVESQAGAREQALRYLAQALDRDPGYAPALFNMALLYQRELKDASRASAYFRRFLEAAGDDPHVDYARKAVEDLAPAPKPPPAPAAAGKPAAAAAPKPAQPAPPPVRTVEDILRAARAEAGRGRPQAALDQFLEAAAKAGRAQDISLQEKVLREAVQACSDQARAHGELGRFLLQRGQDAAALNAFKQAITLDRKFAPGYIGLAEAASRTGEYDAALVALKVASELEPNNADSLWALASLYDGQLEIGEKAMQAYREFEKRFPGDPRIVKAAERLKALESAPVAAEVAVLPAPPPEPPAAPAPAVAPAAQTSPQQVPPAAREPPPAPPPARRLEFRKPVVRNTHAAVQAYNRAVLYQQQDDAERAIYYYTRAIENDSSFATAFFNLASVYWARRDYDLAKDAFLHAIEVRPDMVAARYNLALVHRELKEQEAAVNQLAAIIKESPDYAPAHFLLGLIYAEDPDTIGMAKQHYEKFLELSPDDPSVQPVRQWLATH